MEEQWFCDRSHLGELMAAHPDYSTVQLMQATARSRSWVKKWRKRLASAAPQDQLVLWGYSRARHTPPPALNIDPLVIERILDIRDHPPSNLGRTPGPKTIRYFLLKDPQLQAAQLPAPAVSLIYKVLVLNSKSKIAQPYQPPHKPVELPPPYRSWQLDFKDASSVTIESGGKKQHLVEILNVMDVGSSVLLASLVRDDYNAYTVILAIFELVKTWGLPAQVTFDRDPRFVGSWRGREFPAAFVRMWQCLGVAVNICPPHRPDLNAFVERFHRSQGSECLERFKPTDKSQVIEVICAYRDHYNLERPHQGKSCNNQPPMLAHPVPAQLQPLPLIINPNAWLAVIAGKRFSRKVSRDGSVVVSNYRYYVGAEFAGKYVALEVAAATEQFLVWHQHNQIRPPLSIKGLYKSTEMSFESYMEMVAQEARREQRWNSPTLARSA